MPLYGIIFQGSNMEKIDRALAEFNEMDELAAGRSLIHTLHPLSKLIITIAYIFITVSFDKYDLFGIVTMVLYPVLMFEIAGVSIKACFCKLRLVLPLVLAVGIVNPFLDRGIIAVIGSVRISGGVVSMLTLMMKGVFSLMASFILVATTQMDKLCAALRKVHVPSMIVTLLLLTYRYISVMIEQVSIMTEAYHLRAPDQKGIHISAWGSFLGQLLLRSMDRAQELYESMQLRGFEGEFYYADIEKAGASTWVYTALSAVSFILARYFDVAVLLGSLFTR